MLFLVTCWNSLSKYYDIYMPSRRLWRLNKPLVPLTERDDIEAYLVTFERIMEAHKVEKDHWSQYLAPQLTRRAQLAFATLLTTDSGSYEAIKTAILACYDINEEAYRRRFRTAARRDGETNHELAVRLMDMQRKWLKEYDTVVRMQEVVGIQQFLSMLPMEKLWVMERKPETCVKAGELADEYEQSRRQELGVVVDKPTKFQPQNKYPCKQKKCDLLWKTGTPRTRVQNKESQCRWTE